jgi:hypothetical protein
MLVCCIRVALRDNSAFSMLFRSARLMRWFIIVDCVEKLQCFPSPHVGDTRTDSNFGGEDKHLPQHVVDFTPRLVLQADVEDRVRVSERVHYALEFKLCVYGFFLNASRMPGVLRCT